MGAIKNFICSHYRNIHLVFGLKNTLVFTTSICFSYMLMGSLYKSLICALVSLLYITAPERRIGCSITAKTLYVWLILMFLAVLSALSNTYIFLVFPTNLVLVIAIVLSSTDHGFLKEYKFYYSILLYLQIFGVKISDLPMLSASLFISILIGLIFQDIIYAKDNMIFFVSSNDKHLITEDINHKFNRFKENIQRKDLVYEFACKLAISTSICFLLYNYLNIPFFSWMIFSLCYTLMPIEKQTGKRASVRIIGTIIGALVFMSIRIFISNIYVLGTIAFIAFILYISYIPYNRLCEQFIAVTYLSLFLSMATYSSINISLIRIFYVIIGVSVALLINKLASLYSNYLST